MTKTIIATKAVGATGIKVAVATAIIAVTGTICNVGATKV